MTDKFGLLTLMVGPSGAGKSTWLQSQTAKNIGIHYSHILSSDQLREDLCGDFRYQDNNDEVFNALHVLARARLFLRLPVVVDATNIKKKDRLSIISGLPKSVNKRYFVINRPMVEKYATGGWRNELGFDLIVRHENTFRSQLSDILAGDGLPNMEIVDLRQENARFR